MIICEDWIVDLLRHGKITPLEALLLGVFTVAANVSTDSACQLSNEDLANELGSDTKIIEQAIQRLENMQLIETEMVRIRTLDKSSKVREIVILEEKE